MVSDINDINLMQKYKTRESKCTGENFEVLFETKTLIYINSLD